MTRRKGEITTSMINREWPHQIALRADQVSGRLHPIIMAFCKELSLASRTQSFRRGGDSYVVFSFADRNDAERFLDRFDGEWSLPKDRPKWVKPRAGGR